MTKRALSLGLSLFLLCASFNASAQSDVALATRADKLQKLSEKLKKRDKADRQQAREWAQQKGVPMRRELPDGTVLELQRAKPGKKPVFYITNNVDAADTVSTDEVWPGGSAGLFLDGAGMTVGEWDAGAVLGDHPDLHPRVNQVDGATTISNHSTHVAGTLIGAGVALLPEARGMAYTANLDAYDWNSDTAEMAAAAAAGLLTSNHSYGIATGWIYMGGTGADAWWWIGGTGTEDPNFGYYDTITQQWDQIAFDAPYYLIVKAAGNDRWDTGPGPGQPYTVVDQDGTFEEYSSTSRPADCTPGGYDCLPTVSVAKNILTVGAVDDVNGGYLPLAGPAGVEMTAFSGWGPTDDGRIKPDVVANGWLLMSTYGQDPYYAAAVGTSMAAPNVTGSLLLLQQHYQDLHGSGNFMRAATLKALAIHTADETGAADGPDYEYGWGLLNTKSAAAVISDDYSAGGTHQIIEGSLVDDPTATDTVQLIVSDPDTVVTATLVWTDPPGTPPGLDPTESMLVNDLDLRISNGGPDYEPWVLLPGSPSAAATTDDNTLDNVEQVVVNGGGSGTYSIKIKHKNNLLDGTAQDYSLIISIGSPPPTSSGLLIDEDFSGGLPPGWSVVTSKGQDWTIKTPVSGDPRYDNQTGGSGNFAMLDNYVDDQFFDTNTSLRTSILDLSSATAAVLSFNSFFWYHEFETIYVDVSTDGGSNWSTAWWHQGFSNVAQHHTLDLSGYIAGHNSVMLSFKFESSWALGYDGDRWQIDDVQLEVFGSVTPPEPPPVTDPPGQADNPIPDNGDIGIGVDTILSWSAGLTADSHDVYLGTSSALGPGEFQGNQAGNSFDPGGLSYDTTYYWRVDEVNADGATEGVPWSFTTEIEPLLFDDFIVSSYGSQDRSGTATIEDSGSTLHLTGNLWKQISFPYTVTENTVIEFDFSSSTQGEIHAIGFDDNLGLSLDRILQLYGTQNTGIQDFHNYTGGGGTQHYVLPVGQFYTGPMQYLFFAMDHDGGGQNGESRFSNVRVYEDSSLPTSPNFTSTPSTNAAVDTPYSYDADNTVAVDGTPPIAFSLLSGPAGMTVSSDGLVTWTPVTGQEGGQTVQIQADNSVGTAVQSFTIDVIPAPPPGSIDFDNFTISSYGSQDRSGTATIEDSGSTLHLTGNLWKQISFPYTVTENTVIEFDFSSSTQGEIHAIGFDDNLGLSLDRILQLYGTQNTGIQDFHNYTGGGGTQHYVLPVGQFYTGPMQYLFFAMDHDGGGQNGESRFSNILIYED